MKVICNSLDFGAALSKVTKALSARTTNSILENIKITASQDKLSFLATDLSLTIEDTINAEIIADGEVLVNGKFIYDYTRKMTDGQIELYLSDTNKLNIRYMDAEGYVLATNPDEFPAFAEIDASIGFSMTEAQLKDLINKVVFSVAQDDARPVLKGVLFEIEGDTLTAVALDGYRMAKCTKKLTSSTASMSVIVPGRSLEEVAKLLEDSDSEVKIYRQRNLLKLNIGATSILTRLLDGDFINYRQIIPTDFFTEVTINKKQFDDALDRASLLTRLNKTNQVKLDIKGSSMQISSVADFAAINEKVSISLTGKDLIIAFNVRFLTEALRAASDEFVKLKFNKPESPCVITSADDSGEYLYLVLPIRIL